MCPPKIWQARSVPVRFVSTMSRHSSSGNVSVGARLIFPALLTRMSTLPNAFTDSSSSRCRDARSCVSHVKTKASCGPSPRWPRRSRPPAPGAAPQPQHRRQTSASPIAMARPIPEVPPTTTAVLPFSCRAGMLIAPPRGPEPQRVRVCREILAQYGGRTDFQSRFSQSLSRSTPADECTGRPFSRRS